MFTCYLDGVLKSLLFLLLFGWVLISCQHVTAQDHGYSIKPIDIHWHLHIRRLNRVSAEDGVAGKTTRDVSYTAGESTTDRSDSIPDRVSAFWGFEPELPVTARPSRIRQKQRPSGIRQKQRPSRIRQKQRPSEIRQKQNMNPGQLRRFTSNVGVAPLTDHRYTVTTRMISAALRWAAMRVILMFQ